MQSVLPDLLAQSAERYSKKIAVKSEKSEITYEGLDISSSRLSSFLIAGGVQIGDRVGIFLEKSIDAVSSLFGILKAGACYVPLDTMSPSERNRHIINDCSMEYLITSSRKIPLIREICKGKTYLKSLVVLDKMKKENQGSIPGIEMFFKDDLFRRRTKVFGKKAREGDYAYILYTSGSTGRPKGVLISHKASRAFVDWAYKCFRVGCDDRVSSHAPFHFDLSIFDIFVTLKAGATLCIIPRGTDCFPLSLAGFIEKERISIWYSVPSILINLILYGDLKKRDLSCLKKILFAGEVFPVKHLRRLMKALPYAEYFNLYGPTETNVCAYYPIKNLPGVNSRVPIGKPCKGTRLFVADKKGDLGGDEKIGELCVSGPTLMECYWNNPEETEKVLSGNIFKTGDLAGIDKKGNYIFHGRNDGMIKSRGYRIESGEIESVLNNHPEVMEAAVTAVPDDKTGNRIKAVIVLAKDSSISEREIRRYCSTKLPCYMVPEIIGFRKALPRTSHNKVDREEVRHL